MNISRFVSVFKKCRSLFELNHPTRSRSLRTSTPDKQTAVKLWLSKKAVVTRWTPLSLSAYGVYLYRRGIDDNVTDVELMCYTHLPLRIVSKIWGMIANINVPVSARPYVYGKYSSIFGVNLDEAAVVDFTSYQSLGAFFVRMLKPDVRPIDKGCLVAPCDGKILHCGPTTSDTVEQVKGITYELRDFFGRISWKSEADEDVYKAIITNNDNILHQCVIYLAPGDYHRFHSPCDWKATFRRHFSGKLLSVNPKLAKLIPGLFCVNERAVYVGDWKYGFFSFTPVGATNVGSIEVYKDAQLHTNRRKLKYCEDLDLEGLELKKGELTGQFNMGSTIVLIFEAPKDFKFDFKGGDVVKMGQRLGHVQ